MVENCNFWHVIMNYKLWWTLVMCMVKFSKAARKMCACIWDLKLFLFDLNPIKGKPTLWCPNNLIVTFSSDGTKFWLGFFLFVGTIVKWAATDIWRWAASTRLASPRRSRARSSVSWILRQFQGFVLKSTWMFWKTKFDWQCKIESTNVSGFWKCESKFWS